MVHSLTGIKDTPQSVTKEKWAFIQKSADEINHIFLCEFETMGCDVNMEKNGEDHLDGT